MDQYVIGKVIKELREKKGLTQTVLAKKLSVSDKAISKWETAKGYPDISLLEPLADALGISAIELLSGEAVINKNRSSNMLRTSLYVCPVCGNVIRSTGNAVISCCGITLPALEAEEPDEEHDIKLKQIEDEWFVTIDHPMTKTHYISFFAAANDSHFELLKLYPEGNAEGRFKISSARHIFCYCNRHGLFKIKIKR